MYIYIYILYTHIDLYTHIMYNYIGCWAEKPVTSSSQNIPRSDSKPAGNHA